jgi:hypothetical protein
MAKIQDDDVKQYPDIAPFLKAKEARRLAVARKPVAEKLAMATKLRDATRMIKKSKKVSSSRTEPLPKK